MPMAKDLPLRQGPEANNTLANLRLAAFWCAASASAEAGSWHARQVASLACLCRNVDAGSRCGGHAAL